MSLKQINLNADPRTPGVIQIALVSDPNYPGVTQAEINADPSTPGVIQANINWDPLTPGIQYINLIDAALSIAPSGGVISGSVATFTANQAINLTSLGAVDWAAFGYQGSPSSIERKSTGGSLISALSQVGAVALATTTIDAAAFLSSWTDGSPNASISNEEHVVYSQTALGPGPGMSFTVPADTTSRTLVVYAEVSNLPGNAKLIATLSDGSAPPYVDTSVFGQSGARTIMAYNIVYNAGSSGQTLAVQLINNAASGTVNVGIQAVTLALSVAGSGLNIGFGIDVGSIPIGA